MAFFIRKPDRLEIPNVNVVKERRGKGHELVLLSEEGGIVVDLERGRWRVIKERVDRRSILDRMKIMPNMPERPICASIPTEKGCRPDKDREPLDEDVVQTIMNTERRRADVQDYFSAALFEADNGYILVASVNTEEKKSRWVEFIDAKRLVGVSVLYDIHSYSPEENAIVKIPTMEKVAELETIRGEPLAFTDDEDEAFVITSEGVFAFKVRFRISESHHRASEGAAFIILSFLSSDGNITFPSLGAFTNNRLSSLMLGEGLVFERPLYYIIRKRPAFTHALYVVSRYGEANVPVPGAVHLWEHMLERPSDAIASKIERDGGVFDAETFFDYTSITARLVGESKKDSSKYFERLKDLPYLWTEEDFERERDAVLIEEARRSLSEPSGYVSTRLFRRMYGKNCPLGRSYEDIKESLYEIDLEFIARLHEKALGKRSAFMMLVGNVEETPDPIELPEGEEPSKVTYEETGKRGIEEIKGTHEGVAYVSMAAHIPTISDFDSAVATLIERYLAAHTDAVLYSRLRLEEGLVYDIAAQMYVMRGLNVFVIEFESSPKNVYKAVDVIFEELEKLACGRIDEEVLEYSRNNLLGSLYRAYEDIINAGSSIIRNEIVRRNPFRELREGIRVVNSVKHEEVIRFAEEFLRPERFYVEILMPTKRVEIIRPKSFMAILGLSKDTKVLVQGITGRQGSFHTKLMLEYGTKIVAGVTPGKGGLEVHGVPVYNTVKEAVEETGAEASVIFVPAKFAKDAVMEAIYAGLSPIVVITEHIPERDSLYFTRQAKLHGVTIVGPNCPGVIVPGETKLGIMPGYVYTKGPVGIVSKSGTLSYEVARRLTNAGIGQSGMIGIGGDKVRGMNMLEAVMEFERDPNTKAIVIIGEIGGGDEEIVAKAIKEGKITKPIVAFVAGITAPPGKKMGHAGAIVTGSSGTAQAKKEAFRKAGALVADYLHEIPELVKSVL